MAYTPLEVRPPTQIAWPAPSSITSAAVAGAVVYEIDVGVPAFGLTLAVHAASVVFVASPNNPTGNRMSLDRLAEIVRRCDREDCQALRIEGHGVDRAWQGMVAAATGCARDVQLNAGCATARFAAARRRTREAREERSVASGGRGDRMRGRRGSRVGSDLPLS